MPIWRQYYNFAWEKGISDNTQTDNQLPLTCRKIYDEKGIAQQFSKYVSQSSGRSGLCYVAYAISGTH